MGRNMSGMKKAEEAINYRFEQARLALKVFLHELDSLPMSTYLELTEPSRKAAAHLRLALDWMAKRAD